MQDDLVRPYLPCPELGVITTYYNPAGYAIRRANYESFAAPLIAAGISLLTVECAFGAEPFELASSPSVIQVRGASIMWMKERLLNLAIQHLPPHVTKVAWIDADVLFTNPAWAQQTSALLDRWPIVQLFERMRPWRRDRPMAQAKELLSFARQQRDRRMLRRGTHGAPGFAWAAQRALVQRHGLYDAAIIGGGDILWAYAAAGWLDSPQVRNLVGVALRPHELLLARLFHRLERLPWLAWLANWRVWCIRRQLPALAATAQFPAHYWTWAAGWYAAVRGRMAFTPGVALHLWHGSPGRRYYSTRYAILHRRAFDPDTDLCLNEQGVWEWASLKTELHGELADYFRSRREDDNAE